MTYAGSPLCAAVNALLDHVHTLDPALPVLHDLTEQLRRAHNQTLFDEAQSRELPDSRHEIPQGNEIPSTTAIVREFGDLFERAEQFDKKLDAFIVEHERAVDLLKGLVGLIELVDDQSLHTNHRYVDAVAFLSSQGA